MANIDPAAPRSEDKRGLPACGFQRPEGVTVDKLITANHGKVYLLSDGTVLKQLNDRSKAPEEFEQLQKLYELYPQRTIDGWTYKAIRPLDYDEAGNVLMERASGESLRSLLTNAPEMAYHAGVWLGLFHNASATQQRDDCVLFGDYAANHVLIDRKHRTVTAIDPGCRFPMTGRPEYDILVLVVNMTNRRLGRRRSPASAVGPFARGYVAVAVMRISRRGLRESLDAVLHTFTGAWRRRRKLGRQAIAAPYCAFLRWYLPNLLRKTPFEA